jgi:hypothetical protein
MDGKEVLPCFSEHHFSVFAANGLAVGEGVDG